MNDLVGGLGLMSAFFSFIYAIISIAVAMFIYNISSKMNKMVKEQQRTNQILTYLVESGRKEQAQKKPD